MNKPYEVIEICTAANGERVYSECFEEYETEAEAVAAVKRNFENYKGFGSVNDDGSVTSWFVEHVR